MNRKRITVLGGLALGCGLLALAPAIAGADDPVLPSPSDDVPAVPTSPADFVASASGGQEVPGNASPAFAAAEFRLSEDGTTLSYAARVFGLANPTVAHLHLGPLGVSGPIVVPLTAPGQPGTSGCAAVVGEDVTTMGGSSADHHGPGGSDGSGDDACAAVLPDGATTSTSGGSSTTHAEDGEHTSSTTAAGTSSTSTTTPTATTEAPTTSSTEPTTTTTGGSTTTSEGSSSTTAASSSE